MAVAGAHKRIIAAVSGWDDVEIRPHRYGGHEFRLGKRELGHIHGDALVDIPFPKAHLGGVDRQPQAFFAAAQRLYRCRKFSFYRFQPGVLLSECLEIAKQLLCARSH